MAHRPRCAQSVHHDLKPNIFLSSPLTQSIGTSFLRFVGTSYMNMWKPDLRVFTEYNTCKQDVFYYGVLENCILIRVIKVLKWTITVMLTMFVDVTKVTVNFKKSFLFCHSTALEPNTWLKVIKLIFTPFTNFVYCLNCIHNIIVNLHEPLYMLLKINIAT